jgi:glycosyltransferase involved in cell wall biosynthesis
MRVMFVVDEPDQANGPNVWLTRHLPALMELGLRPEVLVVTWQRRGTGAFATMLEKSGVPVKRVVVDGYAEASVSMLLGAIAADPPDVFVPNCSVLAHLAARFLREAGVATVSIVHSDDRYYHELCDRFVVGRPEWRVSGVVTVSAYLRDLLTARTAGAVPVCYAPYGAPLPDRTAAWRPDRFRAVYAGRLVEYQKRIGRLTSHLVAAAGAVDGFDAVLYGGGEEGDRLAARLGNAPCGARVRLGGVLPPTELQSRMLDAQAFVLLSDFEGLSIALLEAMAAGLVPIVSRMRSGVGDVITDGKNGFVVDADDREAFVRICAELAGNRARWEQLSAAARATVEENGLTSRSCARQWASFLRQFEPRVPPARPIKVPSLQHWNRAGVLTRPGDMIHIHYEPSLTNRLQDLSAEGRPIFVWGAGAAGERFLASIDDFPVQVTGCLDSDARKQGTSLRNLAVTLPQALDSLPPQDQARPFVVIASVHAAEIAATLESRGYLRDYDYSIGTS